MGLLAGIVLALTYTARDGDPPVASPAPTPAVPLPAVEPDPEPEPEPELSRGPLWDPPELENPTVVDVDNTWTIRLDPDEDAAIRLPDEPLEGGLTIEGGRNVVLVGGQVTIGWQGKDAWASSRRGLLLVGQTGTVHVEGVLFDGDDLSEGIQINAPEAVVQIVNVRIEEIRARDQEGFTDNHPDLVQPWGGVKELRIDGLTGTTDYQGIFLKGDYGAIGAVHLSRVNIRTTKTARYLVWKSLNGFPDFPIDVRDVWLDPAPGRTLTRSVRPHLPDPTWLGVRQGVPPGGDFVPAGLAGSGYVGPLHGQDPSGPGQEEEPVDVEFSSTILERDQR